ncbi:peroxisomal coenzyme A diphosphatase NUDT7-like [Carassius carassius]|uniref:peroxisomal coenzyme A diphosphatase NUDT7-like n=1 Tax=Carassius carassius TaxID=217509 RepID=UPI002868C067|nr:peroxisomal coenzyme A diphosphatase NUDT7-like [Carassius carassius]
MFYFSAPLSDVYPEVFSHNEPEQSPEEHYGKRRERRKRPHSHTEHCESVLTQVSELISAAMDLKEKTVAALKKHDSGEQSLRFPELPGASVLIPLLLRDGQLRLLLTVRAIHLKQHAGEVCFPGGKREPGDRDEVHTALREAEEEIGLPPDTVQVICTLFPVLNKTGLLITPVVAFIEDSFEARPNADEVSEVFTVPLEFFTKAADHAGYPVPSVFGPTHSFMYTDPSTGSIHQIWGLTAALAITVAVLALGEKPEFDLGFSLDDPASGFKDLLSRRLSKL